MAVQNVESSSILHQSIESHQLLLKLYTNVQIIKGCSVILYFDLAAATHNGWVSVITPLPMGVGRKGRLELTTNCRISSSARAYAAPTSGYKGNKIRGE